MAASPRDPATGRFRQSVEKCARRPTSPDASRGRRTISRHAPVAQWIERGRPKACVGGSSPSGGAKTLPRPPRRMASPRVEGGSKPPYGRRVVTPSASIAKSRFTWPGVRSGAAGSDSTTETTASKVTAWDFDARNGNEPLAQLRPKLGRIQDALSLWLAGTDQVIEAHARTRQMVGGTGLPGNNSRNCFAYWRLPTRRQSTFTERGMPA
jgi:hypothetical protein